MNTLFKSFEYKAIKLQVKNEESHPRSRECRFAQSSTCLCDTEEILMPRRASAVSSVRCHRIPPDIDIMLHSSENTMNI